jgi:hypothetical protein
VPLDHFTEHAGTREMDFVQNAASFGIAKDETSALFACALSLRTHFKHVHITGFHIEHGELELTG